MIINSTTQNHPAKMRLEFVCSIKKFQPMILGDQVIHHFTAKELFKRHYKENPMPRA
jgi:hypothetical protein